MMLKRLGRRTALGLAGAAALAITAPPLDGAAFPEVTGATLTLPGYTSFPWAADSPGWNITGVAARPDGKLIVATTSGGFFSGPLNDGYLHVLSPGEAPSAANRLGNTPHPTTDLVFAAGFLWTYEYRGPGCLRKVDPYTGAYAPGPVPSALCFEAAYPGAGVDPKNGEPTMVVTDSFGLTRVLEDFDPASGTLTPLFKLDVSTPTFSPDGMTVFTAGYRQVGPALPVFGTQFFARPIIIAHDRQGNVLYTIELTGNTVQRSTVLEGDDLAMLAFPANAACFANSLVFFDGSSYYVVPDPSPTANTAVRVVFGDGTLGGIHFALEIGVDRAGNVVGPDDAGGTLGLCDNGSSPLAGLARAGSARAGLPSRGTRGPRETTVIARPWRVERLRSRAL